MSLIAQAQEAIDAASQAESLGLIGVLALILVAVLWAWGTDRIVSGSQYRRMRDERDAALSENKRLRGMYDRVIVLAAAASAAAAEELRHIQERHGE